MRVQSRNVFWKLSQSALGLVLIAIQSRFISGEELAMLAIAQALIAVVPFFDFGSGITLTTLMISTFDKIPDCKRKHMIIGKRILYSRRYQILAISLLQAIIFGFSFLILGFNLTSSINLNLVMVFILSVFFHSIGINLGKLFVATAEINLLVKLQGLGSVVGFMGSILGLNSQYNLAISVISLSFSSILIGSVSILKNKKKSGEEFWLLNLSVVNDAIDKKFEWSWILQIGQFFQFLQPILVQHFAILNFNNSQVVAYLMCQRIFGAIGNALASDTLNNFTVKQESNRLSLMDVMRFKLHYMGFVIGSLTVIFGLTTTWHLILPGGESLRFLDLLSFIPLGLCIFIDQAVKIRLYILNLFFREMLSNIAFVAFIVAFFNLYSVPNTYVFNLYLVGGFFCKFLLMSNFGKQFRNLRF
jgi:hypothetical protein